MVKNLSANAGDTGWIHELGRSPRGGNSNPTPVFQPKKSLDRRAWQATVHGVAKSGTGQSTQHTPRIF